MDRCWGSLAALLGGLAVALGAFGAHALRERLAPEALATWQTGVLWHALHALALLGVALSISRTRAPALRVAGAAFTAGTTLFSGSLYALALGGPRWLGAITPLGGSALLVGWAALAWAAWRQAPPRGA